MNDRFLQDDLSETGAESMARRVRALANETRNLTEALRALRDAMISLDALSDRLELQRAALPSRESFPWSWLVTGVAGFVGGVAVAGLVGLLGGPVPPAMYPLDPVAPASRFRHCSSASETGEKRCRRHSR